MNEYQRQAYLSALGVDSYMPRWCLPLAPVSRVCELPARAVSLEQYTPQKDVTARVQDSVIGKPSPAPIAEVLRDIGEQKPVRSLSSSVVQTPDTTEVQAALKPFSLSIWRPEHPLLVVAERQTRSALPVEPLIGNILRSISVALEPGGEEVLRWPFVENSKVSLSREEAGIALQTWLEAELIRRPVPWVWLMGGAAVRHLVPPDTDVEDSLWRLLELDTYPIKALITPDPVALLQQPLLKRRLWLTLQSLYCT